MSLLAPGISVKVQELTCQNQKKPKPHLLEMRIKAHAAAKQRACALADDSGITIDALDGAPGVYPRIDGDRKRA